MDYLLSIEILTSVLTIKSSISQFEFLFEQLSTIKLFQCFHIQVVVPFLKKKKKQRKRKLRTAIEWDYGILPPSSIKGLPIHKNV
jgi:hypothetical protein